MTNADLWLEAAVQNAVGLWFHDQQCREMACKLRARTRCKEREVLRREFDDAVRSYAAALAEAAGTLPT